MFFLQMAGFPGSGKSTLAREISKITGAIVLDHDIVKSALMESMEMKRDSREATKISYAIGWKLLDFYLSQDRSVILDSPCFHFETLEKGKKVAKKHGAKYKYIECYIDDIDELTGRLETRQSLVSQWSNMPGLRQDKDPAQIINTSIKPTDTKYLTVNSGQPLAVYLDKAINYITE